MLCEKCGDYIPSFPVDNHEDNRGRRSELSVELSQQADAPGVGQADSPPCNSGIIGLTQSSVSLVVIT